MKKFLSMFLVITLIFSAIPVTSYAMEVPNSQITEVNSYKVRLPFVFLFTGLAAILSGLIGYKIGNDRIISDEKEITLVGSIDPVDIAPIRVAHCTDKILNKFIKKLFLEEIPKLSRNNEFPASYLAAVEFELSVLSSRFNDKELSYKYRKFAEELVSMSLHVGSFVDIRNKKISVGYLKEMLKDAQNLVHKATALTDEMELEKEQNKTDL